MFVGERTMSDEFDSLNTHEKAAVEGALNRCRASRPKLRASFITRGVSTSFMTRCRSQTFTPPLNALPMSSDRKADRNRTAPAVKASEA